MIVAAVVGREFFNSIGGGKERLVEEIDNFWLVGLLRFARNDVLELEGLREILLRGEKIVLNGFGNLSRRDGRGWIGEGRRRRVDGGGSVFYEDESAKGSQGNSRNREEGDDG